MKGSIPSSLIFLTLFPIRALLTNLGNPGSDYLLNTFHMPKQASLAKVCEALNDVEDAVVAKRATSMYKILSSAPILYSRMLCDGDNTASGTPS